MDILIVIMSRLRVAQSKQISTKEIPPTLLLALNDIETRHHTSIQLCRQQIFKPVQLMIRGWKSGAEWKKGGWVKKVGLNEKVGPSGTEWKRWSKWKKKWCWSKKWRKVENWKVKSRALQSSALGWVWGAGQPGAPPLMGSAIKYLFSQYIQEYISPLFDPTTGVSLSLKSHKSHKRWLARCLWHCR